MRVVILGDFPLEPERTPGGTAAVIKNLAVHMARLEGMDVHVVACIEGLKKAAHRTYQDVQIHYLLGQKHLGNVTKGLISRRRLCAEIWRLDPDVVHAHGTAHYALAGLATRYPTVITVHGILWKQVLLHSGFKARLRQIAVPQMERTVLKRARHIFVIAEYVRDLISAHTEADLYPIHNPVRAELFDYQTTDSQYIILSVAGIQRRKGLVHLVEALAEIRSDFPDAELHLVGKVIEPEYEQLLRRKVDEYGLGTMVSFLGYLTDAELQREFASCSLFALSSFEESSPVSIAEAMTLSKPVVATRVGGIPDLVEDGISGYLLEYGDSGALAAAFRQILSKPDLRRRMGSAGRQRAERDFRPEVIARKTMNVYRRVIAAEKDTG